MKSLHRTAHLCNFFQRADWIRYIPTEPLSTHYRPVVEEPFERVLEPIGVETPIVETHWVENFDVFMGGMGDVIDVRVIEEAPLEFTEKIKMINKINKYQRNYQESIINNVLQDCAQEIESFDAQIEQEISQNLEVQLSDSNSTALSHMVNSLPQIESLSALEADLKDLTESETFNITNYNLEECHFQAYKQELEAFFSELRQSERHCPPPPDGGGFTISYRGRGHWNNGGGGGGNNGGSNWNNGGGDDFGGGDPRWNYFGLVVFFGAIIIISRILFEYGYKNFRNNLEKLLSSTKQTKNTLPYRTKRLLPVLVAGPALVVLCYLFHPQRLRELVELLTEMGAILAQQIGRLLLMALPPQLQVAAQRLGHLIEIVGAQLGRFVDQVVLPVALYGRALGVLLLKVYFLLKLASLGLEIYKVCGKAVPDAVVAQAHQIGDLLSGTGEASIVLFVENFLKSVSLLVVGLIPVPEEIPKFIRILGRLCILSFVVSVNGRFFVQKVANGLLSYPLVVSLCGCIAGRWAIILLTVNIARGDTTLRKYSFPFVVLLYVLRVYELAMTASPNFLPI